MLKTLVRIQLTPLTAYVVFLLVLLAGGLSNQTRADHPAHSVTVKLGPGNEEIERQLGDFRDYTDFDRRVEALRGANLSGRDFRRAVLHLELRTLHDVNFDGADLTGADIQETGFDNCTFRGAFLRKIYSTGYEEIRGNCDLTDADISGSYIAVTAEQLRSTRNYGQRDLSQIGLRGDYSGLTFRGFSLRKTLFFLSNLNRSNFTDADIRGATFWCADGSNSGAEMDQGSFSKSQLRSTASYRQKHLDGTRFIGCDFSGVDFSGCNLGFFWNCQLEDADLSSVAFCESRSAESILARLGKDDTRGGYYASYGFIACDLTADQFYSTRTYRSGVLPDTFVLQDMDLDGWDFSGMDLRGVSFRMSSLRGANLKDARGGHFDQAIGLTAEQIRSTWNYKQRHLSERPHTGFSLPESIRKALEDELTVEKNTP